MNIVRTVFVIAALATVAWYIRQVVVCKIEYMKFNRMNKNVYR